MGPQPASQILYFADRAAVAFLDCLILALCVYWQEGFGYLATDAQEDAVPL
jgi:hypothetical protein